MGQLHWQIHLVDGERYSETLLKSKVSAGSYMVTFKSERERRAVQRIFIALENTMYAMAREYDIQPSHANLMNDVFQNPCLHNTFAFYYKHPIYSAPCCFAQLLVISQLILCLYICLPGVHATDAMQYSNQARLIRHSAHRHVLVGIIMCVCLPYLFISCITRRYMFDSDLYDEGVVVFMTLVVRVFFGGVG